MSNTANLGLPLLAQSQAQKHVAVNESLATLDAVTQLTLESLTSTAPPALPVEGQAWGLPQGLSGAWSFQKFKVAVYCNGGWRFLTPQAGWRAYIKDQRRSYLHDGTDWVGDAVATSPNGASTGMEVIEFEHIIATGTTSATAVAIPAYSVVRGVTGRVTQALGGTLGSFRLGVGSSLSRYGSGLKLGVGNLIIGQTGTPLTYFADTPLVLTATGGAFNGGRVRLAIHVTSLTVPRA